jgi:cytochrome c556
MSFKGFLALSVAIVLFLANASCAGEPESQNLIRREMAVLDTAFKAAVAAVVLNEPERIPSVPEEVERIREQIGRTIKSGAGIALPRNQKRFREFVRLDNKFHHDLELLMKAAKKRNLQAVQRQTHRLLDACVRCHTIFRK